MKNALIQTGLYLILCLFVTCTPDPLDIDVSNVEADVRLYRFGQELFETDPDSIAARTPELAKKYGQFFDFFSYDIISPNRGLADPNFSYGLTGFVTDFDMKEVYKQCKEQYPDLQWLEEDLEEAFRHYKYYFPDKVIPTVITYQSGFNYSIATDDTILAIGLDRYLGSDNKYYDMLQYPEYMRFRLRREFIVPDCMQSWAVTGFPFSSKKNFLNRIIYEGKIIYFMDAMLPDYQDTLKLAFTEAELEWCTGNEASLWAHFIDKDLLYSTDEKTIKEYTEEAPFTPGFPEDAPDRSANWIGWQIVKSYVEKHDVSLPELMKEHDGQLILERSGYKP